MSTMGERIQSARKRKGITQKELSKRLATVGEHASNAVISNWEKDVSEPNVAQMFALCKVLDMGPNYLLNFYGRDYVTLAPEDADLINMCRDIDKSGREFISLVVRREYDRCTRRAASAPHVIKTRQINVYTMPASAGTGAWLGNEKPEPVTIRLTEASKQADFAVPITGDSMEPEYHDGDLVLAQRAEALDVGELGLVAVDGEVFFKRIGKKQLESLNPKYKPMKLKDPDIVRVFGRVIGRAEREVPEDPAEGNGK